MDSSVDIFFGTQTGNCEYLAERLCDAIREKGLEAETFPLDDVEVDELSDAHTILVVVSTYGEGEMPDNAELFWEALSADDAPKLDQVRFAVLGLGDSAYDEFCGAAKLIDARLEGLGARRIADRKDCDIDFEEDAAGWVDSVLEVLTGPDAVSGGGVIPGADIPSRAGARPGSEALSGAEAPSVPEMLSLADLLSAPEAPSAPGVLSLADLVSGSSSTPADPPDRDDESPRPTASRPVRSGWTRNNPSLATLSVNRLLSGAGSAKEVRHYEFQLAARGIQYAAGDSLAVLPVNDPELVRQLLEHFSLRGDEVFRGRPVREGLLNAWEISAPSRDLLSILAEADPRSDLAGVLHDARKADLQDWLWGRDTLDVLRMMSNVRLDAAEFVASLRPLQHRAYSISSSPLFSPERIHLTVTSVRYGDVRRRYGGACSTYLADRVGEGGSARVFLQPNRAFRLPADDDAPIVMVGPGVGIAPFRGFLQERSVIGARGANWLFFGDQHRETDFLYREELEDFGARGVLNRLDLAFSRDQTQRVYVQSKMRERGRDLYDWLESGAYFYVCGDALSMAQDVDAALRAVVAEQRHVGEDEARQYVDELRRQKRYLRDVY